MSIFSSKYLKQFWQTDLKFKLGCFLFILLLASTIKFIDWSISQYIGTSTLWRKTHQQLQAEDPKIVFIGSSRFYSGIYPGLFPSPTFVLNMPFIDAQNMKLILDANFERIKLADLIVLEIHPELFFMDPFKMFDHQHQRLEDLGVPTTLVQRGLQSWHERSFEILMPHIGKIRLNPREIIGSMNRTDPKEEMEKLLEFENYGFYTTNDTLSSDDMNKNAIHAINFVKNGYQENLIEQNKKAYLEMIDRLTQNDLTFLLIRMPVNQGYLREQEREWTGFFNPFLKQLLEMTTMIDLSSYESHNLGLFRDANHLNSEGAKKVSTEILQQLKLKEFIRN